MNAGKQEISTPVENGTLISRVVWDNESSRDGIEVVFVRPDGNEEMLFRTTSAPEGMSCFVSLPIEELDWGIEPKIERHGNKCVLDLESGIEQG